MSLIQALEKILADSYQLYLKTQNYHWNIESLNFVGLHQLFEWQYQDLAIAIDELAERIRTLGNKVKSFSALMEHATIQEPTAISLASPMLKELINDQSIIIKVLYQGVEVANAANDEVTADVLINRIKAHEKNRWMLTSSLEAK